MIFDILDISEIEADKLELENIDFDLSVIIKKTVLMMTLRCSEKGIVLNTKIEPDIPKIVVGDPIKIRPVSAKETGAETGVRGIPNSDNARNPLIL